jgi:alkenylglycerophosphocholine/alkenylglycerophosphoethanolamine hydrolase
VGLFFSMWGDIFLMLPREQFIAGLVAFLLGHIAYLIGFNQPLAPLNLPSLILAVMVGLTAARLMRAVVAGLQRSGHASLRLPVLAYSAVISLMLLSALITMVRVDWDAGDALLAAAGAMLFFMSDSVLAWNKFVAPLTNGRLVVIVTYHLGQALIILGAARHFL